MGALASDNASPLVHRKAEDGLASIVKGFRLLLDAEAQGNEGAKGETVAAAALPALQFGAYLCGSVLNECSMGVHHKVA